MTDRWFCGRIAPSVYFLERGGFLVSSRRAYRFFSTFLSIATWLPIRESTYLGQQ